MGCNTCGKGLNQVTQRRTQQLSVQTCSYNLEMLLDWKDKLFCVRDKSLYTEIGITKIQLNSFIGVVLSGTIYEYNICFLSEKLDKIQPYILKIIDLGLC